MLFVPSTEGVDEHSLSWAQAVSWSVSVSTRRASESPLCICALVAALRWRNCCTLVTPVLMRVVAALDFLKEWRRSVLDFQRQRCLQLLVHIISRLPLCVCVCVFQMHIPSSIYTPRPAKCFVTYMVASPLALSCEKENVSFDLPSFGIHAGFGCLSLRSVCSVLAIFSRTSHTKALELSVTPVCYGYACASFALSLWFQ